MSLIKRRLSSMSGTVVHPIFSPADVRFCVVGWNAAENDTHAMKVEELRQYAGRAQAAGLTSDEITCDLLDAGGALFETIDVTMVDRPGKRSMLSIVAIAAGGRTCIETASDVDVERLRA